MRRSPATNPDILTTNIDPANRFLPVKALQTQPGRGIVRLPADPGATRAAWIYPHLWSLDAPLVAVVWQRWWARAAGASLDWRRETVLALAVWLIYLADRLADSRGGACVDHGTARHAFAGTWRTVLGPLAGGIALFLMVATPRWLSTREFWAGLGLLALAGGYFAGVHRWRRRWTAFLPKEAAVGGLFALGSFLFVGLRLTTGGGLLTAAVAGFAALCFLNCALISRWEKSLRDRRDPASLCNAFPRLTCRLGVACWGLAAGAVGLGWWTRDAALCPLAVSAALLGVLDAARARVSPDARRVLVDAALLSPVIFLLFG